MIMATAPTPTPAPAGQNIAQSIGQALTHILPHATSIHAWIWILIVSLFGGHIVAGLANIFFGKLAMIIVETILMLVMWIFATHPAIIAAELAAAMTIAGTDPDINIGDAAKSILVKWISLIATVNAYAIGIPMVVLILLDIHLGGSAMLMLLFISIPLAMFTNKLNPEGTLALEIAQAGLIGAMVKIAIPLIEKAEPGSVGELIRNDLVNYATPIGIVVMICILFGFGWVKTGGTWLWSNVITKFFAMLHPKNIIKLLFSAIVLGTVIFIVYWFFNPKDAMTALNNKVAKMQEASLEAPPTNESEWDSVATKTCEVAWNNSDFKDGWCLLKTDAYPEGIYPAGEYRFKISSSLQLVSNDGGTMNIPSTGESSERWRNNNDTAFADHFDTYAPVKNKMIGMVIFKVNNESPLPDQKISTQSTDTISVSVNFPSTEANWKKVGFGGKITVTVLKKKTG
jgi:hypothetical protein